MDNRRVNKLLTVPKCITTYEYGTGDERLGELSVKLDELSRILTSLKELPLAISSIYGTTSAFRRTEPFPPLPHCFKYTRESERALYTRRKDLKLVPKYPLGPVAVPYLRPLDVCVHLESSGHWPDDLECIARLKAAFHVKVVQILRQVYGIAGDAKIDYFDIFFKGTLFRVRVCTSSELMLVRTRLNEQGVRVMRETAQSLAYERLMFDSAKMTAFAQAFEKRHDNYSGVCRLAKRWLAAHFLFEYFEEEAVDLICAYLFAHPGCHDPPRSLVTGFLRFLELLASFDWKNQPLIVDPDKEIKSTFF